MIDINSMSCGYTQGDVIKNISLSVKKGEMLCIIGANGCGKTTLMRAVSGKLKYSGSIKVQGSEVKNLRERELALLMASVQQSGTNYFPYTVEESVAFGRYAHEKSGDKGGKNAVEDAMHLLGLMDISKKSTDELSGGQLQRVAIARAFAQETPIIIMDEPTNHLDIKYQLELLEHLNKWRAQGDRCVVAVMHDLNLVQRFAERVLLLKDGEIYADGTPDYVLTEKNLLECYGTDVYGFMRDAAKSWLI